MRRGSRRRIAALIAVSMIFGSAISVLAACPQCGGTEWTVFAETEEGKEVFECTECKATTSDAAYYASPANADSHK